MSGDFAKLVYRIETAGGQPPTTVSKTLQTSLPCHLTHSYDLVYSRVWKYFSSLCCTILYVRLHPFFTFVPLMYYPLQGSSINGIHAFHIAHGPLYPLFCYSFFITVDTTHSWPVLAWYCTSYLTFVSVRNGQSKHDKLFSPFHKNRKGVLRSQPYTTGTLLLKIQISLRPPMPKSPSRPIGTVASSRYPCAPMVLRTIENRGGRSCCLTVPSLF